ncbi:MAG: DnaJ domain-containing protein [Candidatus Rokubacteria bacterium]|nr:DnaJ domain-containing protein [Candidatus Rokubacteria bacterium]
MRTRSWTQKDYYQILGVKEAATENEVKRAYRRLALQHHPDRNRGDRRAEERFKEIAEAYAVLVDPVKRREYDAFRRAQARQQPFRGRAWSQDDLFRDLFSDPRSVDLFEELGREFSRLGFRFNDRFFRDTFFGGRGIFFGGVVVFGPFGIRRMAFRPGREAMGERRPREARLEPLEIPSLAALLGWLGQELKAVLTAPAEGARRLLALAGRRGGDLIQSLEITAEEARTGAPKRVAIQRDGRSEEVLVKIPPGVRQGTRLRLRGKGMNGGDLYLKVEIGR